jgi:hypothetical protein
MHGDIEGFQSLECRPSIWRGQLFAFGILAHGNRQEVELMLR